MSPALAGGFLTAGPPGKPWKFVLETTILELYTCQGRRSCTRTSVLAVHGSVVVAQRFSGPEARGIFPDQGSNPCPCLGRGVLNHWTTREALSWVLDDKGGHWQSKGETISGRHTGMHDGARRSSLACVLRLSVSGCWSCLLTPTRTDKPMSLGDIEFPINLGLVSAHVSSWGSLGTNWPFYQNRKWPCLPRGTCSDVASSPQACLFLFLTSPALRPSQGSLVGVCDKSILAAWRYLLTSWTAPPARLGQELIKNA